MIPWVVAGISVLALVVMLAMNRRGAPAAVPVADAESREVRPPDISQLSPRDAADRLFDRIMRLQEEGKRDSVNVFAPMASTAYAMVAPLDADARFHLGAIGIATGDSALARLALAQADTILAGRPTHLLGLVLGAQAAAALGDRTALRAFNRRLLDARGRELAQPLDEYLQHRPVIDSALRTARTTR